MDNFKNFRIQSNEYLFALSKQALNTQIEDLFDTTSPNTPFRRIKCALLNGKYLKSNQLKSKNQRIILLADGLSVSFENLYCHYSFITNQVFLHQKNVDLVLTFYEQSVLISFLLEIEKWVILNDFNRYVTVKELDKGSFGMVALVKDQLKKGKLVTLKLMKIPNQSDKDSLRAMNSEIKILRRIDHKNVLKLKSVLQNENSVVLITEYLNGENLENFLKQNYIHEDLALDVVKSILQGISNTHKNYFVHRDIKPQNVMSKISKKSQEKVWKIIDFGMAENFQDNSPESLMRDRTGTVCYMAPEILDNSLTGGVYDERVDVYSAGIVLFELFSN